MLFRFVYPIICFTWRLRNLCSIRWTRSVNSINSSKTQWTERNIIKTGKAFYNSIQKYVIDSYIIVMEFVNGNGYAP